MTKLLPSTPLNDAIRRIAEGHTGAASVIALLNRERPENIMSYLKAMDDRGLYGIAIYNLYEDDCKGNLEKFIFSLSSRA